MSLRQAFFKPAARVLLALALLVTSSASLALGLGEIRVKSQPGQPLVAEIPVISSEPGELEQLRARLASPVIFERVGLQRPSGLVNQLDFAVALSEDGKPMIRVTSQSPVDTPSVNFLIEVDWGQGRLVREYSALVGAPGAVAAAEQPQIQAPTPAPSSRIDRNAAPAMPIPLADAPPHEVAPVERRPASVPMQPGPVAAPTAAAAGLGGSVTVQQGQSLSQIARGLQQGGTLDQTMIALLRANPEAFIGNNINRLRTGVVLRVPAASETAALAAAQASAMVRQQVFDWRKARQPVPQPAGAAPATATPALAAVPTAADARLEIAPPAANAVRRAGTTSGTEAGGEGDMLANEQLRQTREDLAARSAEVQELKAQVAELEKLKNQQSKLIAMKDSDLAAAQKNLGRGQPGEVGVPTWLWIGLALVIVGLLAWALLRQSGQLRPAPAYKGKLAVPRVGPFETEVVAAPGPDIVPVASAPQVPEPIVPVAVALDPVVAPEAPQFTPVYVSGESKPHMVEVPSQAAATPAWMSATAKPTWHTVDGPYSSSTRVAPTVTPGKSAAAVALAPIKLAVAAGSADRAIETPLLAPSAGGRERLELAIAYLDLGDTEAARSLLEQLVLGDDPQARTDASQLLRELG